jgi:hypothetical protein
LPDICVVGHHLLELASETQRHAGSGLLAVGDLDYGEPPLVASGARRPVASALPGTRLEVERIARAYRAAFARQAEPHLLTGKEADAPRLKQELSPSAGAAR